MIKFVKMKKKIVFAVATGFFAVATVFNMNLLQGNSAGDVSLDAIGVMAKAQSEWPQSIEDTFGNYPFHQTYCSPCINEKGQSGIKIGCELAWWGACKVDSYSWNCTYGFC